LRAAGTDDVGAEPDPIERLRMPWEPAPDPHVPDAWVLAATDPAQPHGAALAWPDNTGHPARALGAYVVLVDGHACAYLERGGRTLLTFPAASDQPSWPDVFASLVGSGRVRRLRIETIDGVPAASSGWADALRGAGFVDGYKGLSLGA